MKKVVLLVLLALFVGVGAVAWPELALQWRRYETNDRTRITLSRLRHLDMAIRHSRQAHGTYPLAEPGNALPRVLQRHQGKEIPGVDGWGFPIRYAVQGEHHAVWSPGGDGEDELPEPWDHVQGTIHCDEPWRDVVLRDGSFVRYPFECGGCGGDVPWVFEGNPWLVRIVRGVRDVTAWVRPQRPR